MKREDDPHRDDDMEPATPRDIVGIVLALATVLSFTGALVSCVASIIGGAL